ncbi:MAG: bifunctional adenosylcobinamide kinase/adenosylcobinamide-phosphate guanylyltransferase [Nocardioides sp.]
MKALVTGGVRSGKSAYAEGLLAGQVDVTYVAPGPAGEDDPDWAARIAAHRARRPAAWTTVETHDLATAVREATGPVLVDCLGTWVTGVLDEEGAWDATPDEARGLLERRTDDLVAALAATDRTVVLVTNEVGMGVVPAHRSGRLFRDLLGTANQRVAAACDDVLLVVSGRVLRL